ncbi:MAG: hypothetical protein JWQ27_2709 [Ferruginibacter sp.]|nr:hypothetical protein [Ferruginibacter sp.]
MDNSLFSGNMKAGTLGGTFLVLLLKINGQALLEAALIAATGAAVSFTVSWFLKYITRKFAKK